MTLATGGLCVLLAGSTNKGLAQVEEAWAAAYSSPGGFDQGIALAVDSERNVYVAGQSMSSGTTLVDLATVKYDPEGKELWAVRYDGGEGRWELPRAMAVDGEGNVYVTGITGVSCWFCASFFWSSSYLTIKYSSGGEQLWIARYGNEGGGDYSWSDALVVDGNGTAYVTGRSEGGYATVKYDVDGNRIWAAHHEFSGAGTGDIALGDTGAIYVAGNAGIVKYSPEGEERWRRSPRGRQLDDVTRTSIECGPEGTIYATGTQDSQFVTVKYSVDGSELWARTRRWGVGKNEAHDISVDREGAVCVTGEQWSHTFEGQYLIVKYDTSGNEMWVATYPAIWPFSISGPDVALDATGDVTVATPVAVLRYSPGGDLVWQRQRALYPNSLVVDDSGVYVTGGTTQYSDYDSDHPSDIVTARYSPRGDELWVSAYDGPGGGVDEAADLAVDRTGSAYVTGSAGTVRYDSRGNQLAVLDIQGTAVALDTKENLVVTKTWDDGYATSKYSPEGVEIWAVRYDGERSGKAYDLAVQEDDRIYVVGSLGTVIYDGDGKELSVFGGTGRAIAVDATANVYLTGESGTARYDPAGNEVWLAPAADGYQPQDLAIDGHGNIYVTGSSPSDRNEDSGYLTRKYDSRGNQVWEARYDGPEGWSDRAYVIYVDSTENVYVTGTADSGCTEGACWSVGRLTTVKYDHTGTLVWIARHAESHESVLPPLAHAVIVNESTNDVFVAGTVNRVYDNGVHFSSDYLVVKYTQLDDRGQAVFIRGDCNADGTVNISDATCILNWLFASAEAPGCVAATNANGDEATNIADATYLLNHLFSGGPAPLAPFPDCGPGRLPADKELGCANPPDCQ